KLGPQEIGPGRQTERTLVWVHTCGDIETRLRVGKHDIHMRIDAAARRTTGIDADRDVAGRRHIDVCAHVTVAVDCPRTGAAAGRLHRQTAARNGRLGRSCVRQPRCKTNSETRYSELPSHPPVPKERRDLPPALTGRNRPKLDFIPNPRTGLLNSRKTM